MYGSHRATNMSDPLRMAKLFLGVATVASVGVVAYQIHRAGKANAAPNPDTAASLTAGSASASDPAATDPPDVPAENVVLAVTSNAPNSKIVFRGETNTLPFRQEITAGNAPEVLEVTAPLREGRRYYVKLDRSRQVVVTLPNGTGLKDATYDETAIAIGTGRAESTPVATAPPSQPIRLAAARRGEHSSPPPRDDPPPSVPATPTPTVAMAPTTDPASTPRADPPAVAAPPPVAPGTVDLRGVRATIRNHAPEVSACYERARLEKSDLHGKLAVAATLGPSGQVLNVAITSSSTGSARLETCVLGAFRGWAFPAPAGGVNGNIAYTFNFD